MMKKGLLFLLLLISIAGFSQSAGSGGKTARTLTQKSAALSDTTFVNNGTTQTATLQSIYTLFGVAGKLDSTIAKKRISDSIATRQPLENQRVSTTSLPQFTGVNILPQSNLSVPASGFTLTDSTGAGATFIFPSGIRKSLNWGNVTASRVWKFQNKSYTLADSADVAALQTAIAAKPDSIDLIIDDSTLKGSGSVSAPLGVNHAILNGKLNVVDTTAKWVNSITKNFTGDSIVFYIGGVRRAVKDSIGGAGSATTQDNNLNIYHALGSTIQAETFPINRATANNGLTSQQARFMPVWLPQATTLNGIKWYQVTQGVYTGNNYNGIGLYTYAGGTLTLVASTSNDAAIWSTPAANTFGSKAFSAPYNAASGLYFIAVVYSSSAQTTSPALGVTTGVLTNITMADFTNSARLYPTLSGLSSLPATTAMSSTTVGGVPFYLALY